MRKVVKKGNNKKKEKLLAMFLTLAMLVSILPFSTWVYAAEKEMELEPDIMEDSLVSKEDEQQPEEIENIPETMQLFGLQVQQAIPGDIGFAESRVDYIIGQNEGVVSNQVVTNQNADDNGEIQYQVVGDAGSWGVKIDTQTGEVTVEDYNKLGKAIENSENEVLVVTIQADKGAGMSDDGTTEEYTAASATYDVNISFMAAPSDAFTLEPNVPDGNNDWYKSAVKITSTADYMIVKDELPASVDDFAESVVFNNQGVETRYVYVKENATGGISRMEVDVKIDTVKPDVTKMSIEIPEISLIEKIGKLFGFCNPNVTVTFIVECETGSQESGIDHVDWTYTKEEDVSGTIVSSKGNALPVKFENGKYVAEIPLTSDEAEQLRGNIAFTATDKAGNVSDERSSDAIIIVDTISPTMTAEHRLVNQDDGICQPIDNQYYYNGDVNFTFTIIETNFFKEDVQVSVVRDGKVENVQVDWTEDSAKEDIHYGTFTLSEDGDYVVSMNYTYPSGNDVNGGVISYQSEQITIDTTAPVLGFEFNQTSQKTKFVVTEHNFRAEDIVVTGTMKDADGNELDFAAEQLTSMLQNAQWTKSGDVYTYEMDFADEGFYELAIKYKHFLCHDAVTLETSVFMIDHEKPYDVKIEYSKSIIDMVLETVTLGFYNPDVTVTFTAYDKTAGVASFIWSYTQETGSSTVNYRQTDSEEQAAMQAISANRDARDKSKYTAEMTLTATEAEQLRGFLSVIAVDECNNRSDKVTDAGHVFVVDTISPTMSVEYDKESRKVGTNTYYIGNVNIAFTVTEANFFVDDVIVTVSKDGGAARRVNPSWTDQSVDVHLGTYTLSGDGDYVIYVEYKDRSTNQMATYESHVITIDTIDPIVSVEYKNQNMIHSLKDTEGNERKYFDDTQTAVITVTEHNFNANEVEFFITAKDVAGQELNTASLYSTLAWKHDGDVHTVEIIYQGDANYTFDVAYSDLATRKADDYAADYFTVDRTAPENLTVDYSNSILDTVLGDVPFGFYNAKMQVTLHADDAISGVHSFLYSYVNAPGVSGVNAELINAAIADADITYSNGGRSASITFEIPRDALGGGNQFNGNVEFTAADRSENRTDVHKEARRIVVDTIAPTAQVGYGAATNTVGGISYYNGNINATITINEANFYAQDVQVTVSRNGGTTAVTPTWRDNSADVHVGTFTLSGDGDYFVTVNYRDRSANTMTTYTSGQMTIDTEITAPTYSINGVVREGDGGAYKNDATISFDFGDQNFAERSIRLTRTRFNFVEDVTETFINVAENERGGTGSFTIPAEVENDGIYILEISMTDRAGHSTESQLKFTINRYGSVYEYDEYLMSLIRDGGQYLKIEDGNDAAITDDLVITEYNADQLIEDSLKILVTHDGEKVDVKYTSNPASTNDQVGIGENGWYQYIYTIKASNFEEDGVYKITLASEYAASDSEINESVSVPVNSMDAEGNQVLDMMTFTVDTTAPEIRNIVNLDEGIVNAQSVDVKYTVVDVGGLDELEVVLNGETVDKVTEFGENAFNYSDQFTISESENAQTVQIRVVDRAGNVTDTATDDFDAGGLYGFHDEITVSTNAFVRWYANKPLFWGSVVGGVAVLAGAAWAVSVILGRRKKKV